MKKFFSMVLILIILSFGCQKKAPIVALIGGDEITVQQLKEKLSSKFRTKDFKSMPYKTRLKGLHELLDEKIKYLYAKDLGITTSPSTIIKAELAKARNIYGLVLKQKSYEYAHNEKNIHDYYDGLFLNAHIRHILIGYKGSQFSRSLRSEDEARKFADSLKNAIQNKKISFADAAMKYSEGPSRKKSGDIGWVPKSRLVKEFADAAFNAPLNQIIGPVKTVFGFHIIQVLEKKKSPAVTPLPMVREKIIESLEKSFQMQANKLPQLTFKEIQKKYAVNINQENIDRFMDMIKKWQNSLPLTIDSLFNQTYSIELISSPDLPFSAGRFIYSLPDPLNFFKNLKDKNEIISFLKKRLNFEIIVREAYKNGEIDRDKVDTHYKNIISYGSVRQLEAKWRSEIKLDEKEVEKYYKTHLDDYKIEPRIDIWEIATKDERKALNIYNKLKKNPSKAHFEKLARQYSEKKSTGSMGGHVGFQTRDQYANISRTAFETGPNRLIAPRKLGHYFYILRTGELKPAIIKPYQEVRSAVEQKLYTQKYIEYEKEKMKSLKKQYPYTILEKNLRDLL